MALPSPTSISALLQQSWAFVSAGTLPPTNLLKALISKLLGYGILTFSILVKLPQVANVLRARSAEGLSALSFELESWGLLVHATYGYLKDLPFSAYGEAVMMLAQNVLLLALIYKYARMPVSRALAAAIVGVSFVAGVFTGQVTVPLITAAYDFNNVILMSARVPQILQNFQSKSTGQLSIITFAASTLGCVARLFTTMQEGGGSAMMRSYALSLVLNSILVAQILVYGNKGVAAQKVRGKAAVKKAA